MACKNWFSTAALFFVCGVGSGMCELTNRSSLGIQEWRPWRDRRSVWSVFLSTKARKPVQVVNWNKNYVPEFECNMSPLIVTSVMYIPFTLFFNKWRYHALKLFTVSNILKTTDNWMGADREYTQHKWLSPLHSFDLCAAMAGVCERERVCVCVCVCVCVRERVCVCVCVCVLWAPAGGSEGTWLAPTTPGGAPVLNKVNWLIGSEQVKAQPVVIKLFFGLRVFQVCVCIGWCASWMVKTSDFFSQSVSVDSLHLFVYFACCNLLYVYYAVPWMYLKD